ncbi:hypothetical protein MTR67_001573 [Solanum verrucosum]|uniref:Gag-pol polyprotein n=1 Tax=Solanum verrucosum TaxID=315347 RepID=A0AAF0PNF1_SOLVR|nr:hypothetical protein MTR67_001573 [Solanum verrucosum]
MFSQVVTNQSGQQRGIRQDIIDTSKIREFLRMNPPDFIGSSVTEDPENFVEEVQKVVEVMHVADAKCVELASNQLKGVSGIRYDQWKKSRAKGAPIVSWDLFESSFMGRFFSRELIEAKDVTLQILEKEKYSRFSEVAGAIDESQLRTVTRLTAHHSALSMGQSAFSLQSRMTVDQYGPSVDLRPVQILNTDHDRSVPDLQFSNISGKSHFSRTTIRVSLGTLVILDPVSASRGYLGV